MKRKLVWIIAAIYWLALIVATHLPPAELPKTHVSDKVEHFTAYFFLCLLLQLCVGTIRKSPAMIGCVLIVALSWGAIDELSQPPFGRTCDVRDWYADAAGATAASVLAALLFSRRACSSAKREVVN